MDSSALELRRQQRARDLREMKEKLEALKRRNQGAMSGGSGDGGADHLLPLDQLLQGIDLPDLDKLEARAAADAAARASSASVAVTAGSDQVQARETPKTSASQPAAPATPIMYSKGIQTTAQPKPATPAAVESNDQDAAAENEAPPPPPPSSVAAKQQQQNASGPAGTGHVVSDGVTDGHQQEEMPGTAPESVAKAIMASPEFAQFVASSAPTVERALHLSQKHEYLDVLAAADAAQLAAQHDSDADLAPAAVGDDHALFDPRCCRRRAVTALAWTEPPTKDLCVVGYSVASGVSLDPDGLVCVWSPDNLLGRAEFVLRCHSAVTAVAVVNSSGGSGGAGSVSPLIVAGTYSGQVVMWDLRAGSTPVQRAVASAAAGGHTHPIYSLAITGTADSPHIATCSTDGRVCFWALDSFTEPLETLDLTSLSADTVSGAAAAADTKGDAVPPSASSSSDQGGDGVKSGSTGAISAAAAVKADDSSPAATGSSKLPSSAPVAATAWQFSPHDSNVFFVGSEEGKLYSAVRHGAKRGVSAQFAAHMGPITALDCQRASLGGASARLLLSTSVDWSCKLWGTRQFGGASGHHHSQTPQSVHPHRSLALELGGLTEPLLSFDDADDAVMDARWSPVQPSVFATAAGANVSLWNLLHSTEVPVAKQSPSSSAALNKLCWSRDGSQLAVGDSEGYVHLFHVGPAHRQNNRNKEKNFDSLIRSLGK